MTNQAAHTLTGTGETGSLVTLFDNGSATALGTATVGSNGTWSYDITLSGNGSHSIVARETMRPAIPAAVRRWSSTSAPPVQR